MKILLVNPPPGRPEVPIYPLGLAYIATALTGHVLRGCDLQLENEPDATLIRILTEFEPDVVAMSTRQPRTTAIPTSRPSMDAFTVSERAYPRPGLSSAVPDSPSSPSPSWSA